MALNTEIGTIDKLLAELTKLKETLGGEAEVIVMKYTGGNDDPFYVKAEATDPNGEHSGRVLLEIAGPQQ